MNTSLAVKLRIAVVALLIIIPIGVFYAFGAMWLNEKGWSFYAWIGSTVFFLAAYLLGWYWTRRSSRQLLPNPGYDDPLNYWTERDKAAWQMVEKHAEDLPAIAVEDLKKPEQLKRFADEAQTLALKVTQVYLPNAKDPFGHLTLPEILTCFELVTQDMSELLEKYVPGSGIVTVNNLKQIQAASQWYQTGQNIYWLISAFMNPLKAAAQVIATKAGIQSAFSQVQKNVMTWFYLAYVHQLGRYLIELNSGRLKVGAKKYRELMAAHKVPPVLTAQDLGAPPADSEAADVPLATHAAAFETDTTRTTVAIVGPVNAGKSSLINAVFGEARAEVGNTPLTDRCTRYDLNRAGLPPLSLIDTVGFGVNGAGDKDIQAAVDAVSKSDIAVLVVPARSAARGPEVDFLDRVRKAFDAHPDLKMPPTVAVLTHIDQLSPAMEWQPPYDWRAGSRPKEQSIRDAVAAAKELFGGRVLDVFPACTAEGKNQNVRDDLLPAIAEKLGEARGVRLLRALKLESAVNQTKKVLGQVWNIGKEAVKAVWKSDPKGVQ